MLPLAAGTYVVKAQGVNSPGIRLRPVTDRTAEAHSTPSPGSEPRCPRCDLLTHARDWLSPILPPPPPRVLPRINTHVDSLFQILVSGFASGEVA